MNSTRSLPSIRATAWLTYSLHIVGVEAQDLERELLEHLPDDRQQVRLGKSLRRGDHLKLDLTGDYLWRSSVKTGAGRFRPLRPLAGA